MRKILFVGWIVSYLVGMAASVLVFATMRNMALGLIFSEIAIFTAIAISLHRRGHGWSIAITASSSALLIGYGIPKLISSVFLNSTSWRLRSI